MINKVFTVHDIKAEAYLPPFFFPTAAMAHRAFTQAVNSTDHQFAATPEDFTLLEIGEFDDETGELKRDDHRPIAKGLEVKKMTSTD